MHYVHLATPPSPPLRAMADYTVSQCNKTRCNKIVKAKRKILLRTCTTGENGKTSRFTLALDDVLYIVNEAGSRQEMSSD